MDGTEHLVSGPEDAAYLIWLRGGGELCPLPRDAIAQYVADGMRYRWGRLTVDVGDMGRPPAVVVYDRPGSSDAALEREGIHWLHWSYATKMRRDDA